jgi:hypothetical protein
MLAKAAATNPHNNNVLVVRRTKTIAFDGACGEIFTAGSSAMAAPSKPLNQPVATHSLPLHLHPDTSPALTPHPFHVRNQTP